MNNSHVTIVGAGLVGSLLAITLARRGLSVTLIERRPDMRVESIAAGRSINLAISARGLYALERVGLKEKVLQFAVPMLERKMHAVDGALSSQPYGKNKSEYINSISRGDLNKILMTEAEKTGRVKILFNTRVLDLNPDTAELRLFNELTQETDVHSTARVIGTDGAASAVRQALVNKNLIREREVRETYGYKELTIPPIAGGGFALEKNALHIWPRSSFMLIALPNCDGSFTCTLFLSNQGATSFETLSNTDDVQHFFETHFSDAKKHLPHLTSEFFENPTGHLVTLYTECWHYKDKVLLMGDAAHAIVPFFGQGMNCGFEDVTEFDDLLAANSAPQWSTLFEKFNAARKPNADAIAHMALENFVEMRDKVGNEKFLFRKQVERELQKRHPDLFIPRYSLVTFLRVPYAYAENVGKIQDEILDSLCGNTLDIKSIDWQHGDALVNSRLSREVRV